MNTDTMLSRADAAQALGIHRATLDRWRKANYGPPWHRIGQRYLYPTTRLNEWIDSREGATNTPPLTGA